MFGTRKQLNKKYLPSYKLSIGNKSTKKRVLIMHAFFYFVTMIEKRLLIVLLLFPLLFIGLDASSQKKFKPKWNKSQQKKKGTFPSSEIFKPGGWLLGAGLTGTFGLKKKETEIIYDNVPLNAELNTQIRPGITFELGRYYNFKKKAWFADYGIGYKLLWATENFELTSPNQGIVYEGSNSLRQHYATAFGNINHVIDITDMNFIVNGIGINADYRAVTGENKEYPEGFSSKTPNSFVAQAHYKLGFGIKLNNDLVIIPSVETPIFNLTPTQDEFSQLDVFNSSFQSIILKVRVLFFNLRPTECPKVNNPQLPGTFKNGYGD